MWEGSCLAVRVKKPSPFGAISSWLQQSFGPNCSGWQANALAKAVALGVGAVSGVLFCVGVIHGILKLYAGGFAYRASFELAFGLMLGALMLIAAEVYRFLYFEGHEIKEKPVVEEPVGGGHGTHWQRLYPNLDMGSSLDRSADEEAVARYAAEFFFNALVNPRTVFTRISEHVSPGSKMLDCCTDYEVSPHPDRNIRIHGISDYPVRGGDGVPCYLPVPVSFQPREDMAVSQDVTNAGNVRFPRALQSEITTHIIAMIERYEFSFGRLADDDMGIWSAELRGRVEGYLDNTERNTSLAVPLALYDYLSRRASSREERKFAERVCYMLAGLRDVTPVCVGIHAVALPGDAVRASSVAPCGPDEFPRRVFNLRYEQKVPTSPKRWNMVPEGSRSPLVQAFNSMAGYLGRRGNTVYYNLARAGRAKSYHLYLEGPEGTYYARGSLLRANPNDHREITAEYVEKQQRLGQRRAHIYVRNGHRMSNALFMFRYMKAPIDTYHILAAATFLGVAVLIVTALTSIGSLNADKMISGTTGLSVPAMVLAVATAAGPWVYNRLSDGRSDSLGLEVAVVTLTVCCAAGIVLFFSIAGLSPGSGSNAEVDQTGAVWAWSVVLSFMVTDMLGVSFVALLHSRIYRALTERPDDPDADADGGLLCPTRKNAQYSEQEGFRLDIPQGRYASNPYRLWTEALRDCRNPKRGWDLMYEEEG